MSAIKTDPVERFWSKVAIGDVDDCWEWQAGCSGDGYGAFKVDGRQVGAHRYAFLLFYGAIPTDLHVLHHCDNPVCVNPLHLFAGTQADNQLDKARKQRSLHGERNPKAKLTASDVRVVRQLAAAGLQQRQIARTFGVGDNAVSRIVRRITWVHVR